MSRPGRVAFSLLWLFFASPIGAETDDLPSFDGAAPRIEPLRLGLLPNFHEVSPGIYRSAQPWGSGFDKLKGLGVRTVLNLRAKVSRSEARELERLGMASVHVPMSEKRIGYERMDRALEAVAAGRPILVHCHFGKDRTGFVVAAYRVVFDRWDVDSAVAEARRRGCCASGFPPLKPYLEGYLEHRRGG